MTGWIVLYMVIERFKNGDAAPVYRRFLREGRLAPADVVYVGSWVGSDLTVCYQIMESPDRNRLEEWMGRWKDLVDFEVVPVITSADALEAIRPRL